MPDSTFAMPTTQILKLINERATAKLHKTPDWSIDERLTEGGVSIDKRAKTWTALDGR